MKKILKVGGILFVLIVIAVLAFALTFDANNYKQDIVNQVERQSGRDFGINGDIQLTIFPWIGLRVEQVTLGNAKGFSKRPFVTIAQLEIKIQLLPLLMKELRVDKLRFHGLSTSLETDAAGNNNWSDLIQASTGSSNKTTKPTSATPVSDGAVLAGLFVNGIEFVDAKVDWSDAKTGTVAKILDLKLKTSAIEFDEPVTIELGAGIVSNKPDARAKITLQGNVQFNQALNVFDIKDFQLSAITHMKALTQKPIVVKLKTNTHLDLKQGTAHGDTQVSSAGAAMSSTFNITNLNTKPVINGTLSSDVMNGRVLAEKFQIQLPQMASPQSLTKIAIRSSIQATPASVRLDDLNITLDGSLLSGWVYVSDITQPKVSYKLKLNPIVLDGYLPPAVAVAADGAEITQAPPEKDTITDTQIPLPIDLLRTLDLDGTLDIERVSIKNRHINRITLPAKAAHGIMIVNPVNMNIFDGTIKAKIGLDVRAVPAYIIDIRGDNLKAGMVMDPILAGILGDETVTVEGTAKFDVSVKANGNSVLALKKSAAGLIRMDMNRTTLNGVDVEYYVHGAVADYVHKKNIPFLENFRAEYVPQQKTAFDRLHASFTASQGKLLNKDLILESKRANITGSGYIDIVGESLDFHPVLDIKVENPVSNTDKLKDMPMEFHIYGPFAELKYEFNKEKYYKSVENLFKKEAREKIRKKVETVKQEEKEKIEQKVKNKLKDLFKR